MVKRLAIPLWHLLCAFPPGFENVVNYMKMKPFVAALAVVASLLSFCSCEKEASSFLTEIIHSRPAAF